MSNVLHAVIHVHTSFWKGKPTLLAESVERKFYKRNISLVGEKCLVKESVLLEWTTYIQISLISSFVSTFRTGELSTSVENIIKFIFILLSGEITILSVVLFKEISFGKSILTKPYSFTKHFSQTNEMFLLWNFLSTLSANKLDFSFQKHMCT